MEDDRLLALTYALRHPDTAEEAATALRGISNRTAVEGLAELLYQPPNVRAALAAIAALEPVQNPIVPDALTWALGNPHVPVRLAALEALRRRHAEPVDGSWVNLLCTDSSWMVRRAAVHALAACPDPIRRHIFAAAADPHWRVRNALIQVLLKAGKTLDREEIDQTLAALEPIARIEGVRAYLHYRWGGQVENLTYSQAEGPEVRCPFWDWDPAVLARNLDRLGEEGRQQAIDVMPFLLGHADNRVWKFALDSLRKWGQTGHLVQAIALLDDPRRGAGEAVGRLLGSLVLERIESTARSILHMEQPSPAQLAWALDQTGHAFPAGDEQARLVEIIDRASEQPAAVRCSLAGLALRWDQPTCHECLQRLLADPDPEVQRAACKTVNQLEQHLALSVLAGLLRSPSPLLRAEAVKTALAQQALALAASLSADADARVRISLAEGLAREEAVAFANVLRELQTDPHPHVRAAALTKARAAELIQDPTRDTSWHVRATACRIMKCPLWKLEPREPWKPAPPPGTEPESLSLNLMPPTCQWRVGPNQNQVSPLAISGHYGLPEAGFVRAVEAGVNLLFWEPGYHSMTRFAARLSSNQRRDLHFISGTFEAEDKRIRRDAERALRLLQLDRLSVFLLFWVQSWDRISDDVREELAKLKDEGKIAAFGLSTHSRPLAIRAIEAGWNPLMVRHSAAHRGAEESVLPSAASLGVSVLTFNGTCYGRLLHPPSATDCYRYSLAQPAVCACLSAPADLAQLEENLAVLADPELPPARRQALQEDGNRVYREDAIFRRFVKSL